MAGIDLKAEIKGTAEIYGKQMSDIACMLFMADLVQFTPSQISRSLAACRRELKFFPSVAEIVARIDDGRPGVEEAWAMIPKNEDDSIVWTDEMALAFGVARGLLRDGDAIAARMAFKENYTALVSKARSQGLNPNWHPSFGFEPLGREAALRDAISCGRISHDEAVRMLPDLGSKKRPGERGLLPLSQILANCLEQAGSGTESPRLNAPAADKRGRPAKEEE